MGFVKRLVGAAIVLAVLVFGLQMLASESGEVVVVRTFDASGGSHETRLWIVDDHGTAWLRAGQPEASWYQRVRANPDIQVERGGDLYEYRAFPIEGGPTVSHVNNLMFAKYGWAEQVIGIMIDRSRSVAIRLDPR